MIKKEFLKGVIKPLILKVLESKDKMYGYEITQEVEKLTNGKIKLSYGGLYPILHSLEAEGILLTETTIVGSRTRKYYTLSEKNKDKATEKIQELEEFIATIQLVLNTKIANS
jgi:PadR family transcriptional regulator, regulatory protein PadR